MKELGMPINIHHFLQSVVKTQGLEIELLLINVLGFDHREDIAEDQEMDEFHLMESLRQALLKHRLQNDEILHREPSRFTSYPE